jgi:hypothetical protein
VAAICREKQLLSANSISPTRYLIDEKIDLSYRLIYFGHKEGITENFAKLTTLALLS